MATSVFGADTSKPLIVKAGKAVVTVNNVTLLALDTQLAYQRTVEILPTLGKKRLMSVGEGQGTFTANTVLAKGQNVLSAFKLSGDDCTPFDMRIEVKDAACDLNGKTVVAKNCVASAVSITAQGGRGYIAQGVQVTFTALELD